MYKLLAHTALLSFFLLHPVIIFFYKVGVVVLRTVQITNP